MYFSNFESSGQSDKIEIVAKVKESVKFNSVDEAIEFFKSKGMSEKDWDWDAFVRYMSESHPGAAYMPNPFSWAGVSEEKALEEVSKCIGGGDYKSAASYLRGWKKFHG